jgi:ATP/maltotriose-dependent transcriptional regulator MalT
VQGNVDEARTAILHAVELAESNLDPVLKASVSIQNARVEMQSGKPSILIEARTQLNAAIATAKRVGHYGLECEARLARGQLEAKTDPIQAKTLLTTLAFESRSHGLELVARQAEQAVALSGTSVAADNTASR